MVEVGADFFWFRVKNPGIVTIPIGFLMGFAGTGTPPLTETV